jgi:hypothetical protein
VVRVDRYVVKTGITCATTDPLCPGLLLPSGEVGLYLDYEPGTKLGPWPSVAPEPTGYEKDSPDNDDCVGITDFRIPSKDFFPR